MYQRIIPTSRFPKAQKKDEEERKEKDKKRILEKLEFQDPNV